MAKMPVKDEEIQNQVHHDDKNTEKYLVFRGESCRINYGDEIMLNET